MIVALTGQHFPLVKTAGTVLGAVAEMPLAEDGGGIAVGSEQLRVGGEAGVQRGFQSGDAVDVVVGAAEDGCSAGRADGVGAIAMVESHAFVGDAIQVGSLVDAAAVGAYGMSSVVIRHDEHEVRRLRH